MLCISPMNESVKIESLKRKCERSFLQKKQFGNRTLFKFICFRTEFLEMQWSKTNYCK